MDTDIFPVVASLYPRVDSGGEKQRPEICLCPQAKQKTGNLQGNLGDSCRVGVFIYPDLFAFNLYLRHI